MKKKKILSLILCLSLFCSLIVPASSAHADQPGDSGMQVSKTAIRNNDGTYTITLEAYATGSQQTTTQTRDIPTDIILVLDQSGSMAEDIGTVSFQKYQDSSSIFGTTYHTRNQDYYEYRHNGGSGNLWHKLSDGSYVSVSVTLQQTITYNKITKGRNDNGSSGHTNYWENRNNLYTYVNGEIRKVIYTRERDNGFQNWNCKYALEDGTILNQNNEGSRYSPTFQNTDDGYLYLGVVSEDQNVYTYTYTDSTGTVKTIGTSTGADTKFIPAFYKRSISSSGGGSRLDALKSAVTAFSNAVAAKAAGADNTIGTADDVKHRIAVVGFANGQYYNYFDYKYSNTEVFVGSNQYTYGPDAQGQYANAFQSMNTSTGVSNVSASIAALAADGGTLTNLGLEMANGIFAKNPIADGEKRNRVVVLFTDGVPGWSGFDSDTANAAISQASTAKNTYGATVYSIGIFSGADASNAGNPSGNETQKANWFMQQVSSNNGAPRWPSYYLSAGDAASLNSIFQQISNNITTGGSSTTLGSETVIKDIISPYFTLPAGASASDIRLDTYACTGMNGNTYTWSPTSSGNGDASAAVTGDQVSVTGFDFSKNWCGTETGTDGNVIYRGKKLVITFTVDPKPGFLGGNGVPTNDNAGVYENSSATTPVITFEQPTVDVPIQDVTVAAEDKNVYLLGGVTAERLKTGATVMVGDIPLDLSNAEQNYGLEDWQTAFVDITVTLKKADGTQIPTTGLNNLTDDTTYTIEVTVAPKNEGSATQKTGSNEGKINVFKPELTFKDSEAYYGDTVPTDFSGNKVGSETWKHATATGDILGTAPTLTLSYTPDSTKINGGKYAKQDVPVAATVKIKGTDVTDKTTFVHTACTPACGWTGPSTAGNPVFLIHVKTCTLTINKTGGANNESYVFDVYKDGRKYSEVTIWGNNTETLVELPVGTYTIQENTGWSWRYTANNGSSAELTAQNPTGSITCVNTKNNNQWLNGFSEVVRNIFGVSH